MKIILIVWFTAYHHGSSSITVDGFSTFIACDTAKNEIIHQAKQNKSRGGELIRGFCIEIK
jgi:hypothetical protein